MNAREIMELKSGVGLDEGVAFDRYLAGLTVGDSDCASKVKKAFVDHGYSLDVVPGEFLKIFTMNEKELGELNKMLTEIDDLGLKSIFQNNLRPASFKKSFVDSLEIFINLNMPYLNEDNTFIPEVYRIGFAGRLEYCVNNGLLYMNPDRTFRQELYDINKFTDYVNHGQEKNSSVETEQNVAVDKVSQMDEQDKQVYDGIVICLNRLILSDSTNTFLVQVVKNILDKVPDSILRKEYQFLDITEIVEKVMFDDMNVAPEMLNEAENVKNLISQALIKQFYPTEDKSLESGLVA